VPESRLEWSIFDESDNQVLRSDFFENMDTVSFELKADSRYFLNISGSGYSTEDTLLLELELNRETIIMITSGIEPGDHAYPFHTGKSPSQLKIVGGEDALISDFPWQVFFRPGDYLCGGSIISENWVITAAHCTFDDKGVAIPASEMYVKVGTSTPFSGGSGKIYFVDQVIAHENYDENELVNDIALLKLKVPIDFENATSIELISAVDVAKGATDPGVISTVTGWGLISVNPETFPDVLQKVELPIVSNTTAETVWHFTIPETFLTAGYRTGNKDACNGDSGGPLVVPTDNGYKLAGIVSWGSSDCNTYGAYTRISSFEDWIRNKTGIEGAYTPPKAEGDTIICDITGSSDYYSNGISGVSAYEWSFEPAEAGNLNFLDNHAWISWNSAYYGPAELKYRVNIEGELSQWAVTAITKALTTEISRTPEDTSLCARLPLSLKVDATGDNLKYAFYKDGNYIGRYTDGLFWINSTSVTNSGIYQCTVEGSCGTVESEQFNVNIIPVTYVNSITENTEATFGEAVLLAVDATGDQLHYIWEKDGIVLDAADSPELYLDVANASNTGSYKVVVSGTCGISESNDSYLLVYPETGNLSGIAVWPTVGTGQFTVGVPDVMSYTIKVISSTGALVWEKDDCSGHTIVDLSSYGRGIFIVVVSQDEISEAFKLIII